ncbi:serine/threonine protein kinase [Aspergillus minisclerotigenes]|uniref:Altered inheritance of mitochondria protein 9, mitochondrial n=1 Tax=Aspergillus minisclerotigenes TaxID=656917 RepID=A0A5N6IPN8_9EURO|nr:serine/threonine protein kinase [Aspergillus minisclerotigenes]
MLMTAENGKEVVAKMSIPRIVPMEYSTASEVAVLNYVRAHTAVPVTNIIAWSSDASNPIGSEYILMEKARGRQLVEVWGDMDQLQRFKLIKTLARLEGQPASLEFPGYGNLYMRHSAPQPLGESITVNDEYCLGPAYNEPWFLQCEIGNHSGPWTSLTDLGLALARRDLAHIQNSTFVPRGPHFGSKDEHSRILEAAMDIIPKLAEHPIVKPYSRPTLWHRDIHLGNICICDQDPIDIVSIIDWQFLSVMPAFMQVQWPYFLSPPENYETGLIKPELPSNFDEMDPDEKAFAVAVNDQALLSKCYEAALTKNHLPSSFALTRVHSAIRHLFSSCETTWKDGIIPLRDSLIQFFESWRELSLPGSCPFSITDDDLSKHKLELSRYMDWHKLKLYTQELLHSDDDGWVSPQLDFGKVQERHAELYQLYLQRQTEVISEEAKRLRFYIDRH